jgi:hypothetical protein
MSMNGRFVEVTETALDELLADPDSVEMFLSDAPPAIAVTPEAREQMAQRAAKLMPYIAATLNPELRAARDARLAAMGINRPPRAPSSGIDPETMLKLLEQRGFLRNPGATPPPPEGRGATLSIDKAWHGVHYLLCGEVDEVTTLESQAVAGGTEFGEDLGYGPARYHRPSRVGEIAAALTREGLESEMRARFDPARMESLGIYPGGWQQSGELDWLVESFHRLREFYRAAADRKRAIVLAIE